MKSSFHRTERGNALAMFALTVAGLATIIGLVVRTAPAYTTTQSLQAIADEAALAGSRQFVRNYRSEQLDAAARAVVDSYNIQASVTKVETCHSVAADNGKEISDLSDQQWLIDYEHDIHPGREVCTQPL